ncbi:hypothetical protein BJV78DRAFT_1287928 [Lactifluus subvellereus]|nr:hypothetical protein BJV78DRAFT_1287928 [Lactifluus subvellereus]
MVVGNFGKTVGPFLYNAGVSEYPIDYAGLFDLWARYPNASSFHRRLGFKIQIPLEYASYQIERGQLESAIETIEHGKTLIWSEIYGLRTSIGRLRRVNPGLADRLATVSWALQAVRRSESAHELAESPSSAVDDYEDLDVFRDVSKERRRLLKQRQEVIQKVQALAGFEDFMKALPFRTLQKAACHGPIIVINRCHWRCDILIVLHDSPPPIIRTAKDFYECASSLEARIKDTRRRCRIDSIQYRRALRHFLKELHELVGKPVIDRLRELNIPEQSRVWWYPTSVFCSFPLHTMGPVRSNDGRQQYFSDIYICSYTPTLSALMEARSPASPIPDPNPSLCSLSANPANDSLPGVTNEMEAVRNIGFL